MHIFIMLEEMVTGLCWGIDDDNGYCETNMLPVTGRVFNSLIHKNSWKFIREIGRNRVSDRALATRKLYEYLV